MSERFSLTLEEVESRLRYDGIRSDGLDDQDYWQRIVGNCMVANGCFDILHPGHISLLASLDTISYQEGLRPIVAMNSDESVARLKGPRRPAVPQESRAMLINYLKWPLTVVIFNEDSPQRLMDIFKPKIVLKGAEYTEESVVRWSGSRVMTVPMKPRWSTSSILGDTR